MLPGDDREKNEVMQGLPAVVGLLTWKLEKSFVLWEGSGVVTVFQSPQSLRWLLRVEFWGRGLYQSPLRLGESLC